MKISKTLSIRLISILFLGLLLYSPASSFGVETEDFGSAGQSNEIRSAHTDNETLAEQVIIRRTDYGVPHIEAENIKAAGFALGYLQLEDYGDRVVNNLIRARGEWTRYNEPNPDDFEDAIDQDAANQQDYIRAVETWHLLEKDTRDIMEGFAAGVNRYIELHPEEFEGWVQPFFTGYDVHAGGIGGPSSSSIRRFMNALEQQAHVGRLDEPIPEGYGYVFEKTNADRTANPMTVSVDNSNGVLKSTEFKSSTPFCNRKRIEASARRADIHSQTVWARLAANTEEPHPDVGSNAWALAPSRTKSGNAILVRNPHLSWSAGYYEAQMTVPGVLNFYGDFRIGGPLGIIGGFNERLGWATTNNNPDLDEIYAFKADPERPDHFLLDGASIPLKHETVRVEFKNGESFGEETRQFWSTPFGPVIHRGDGKIYVIKWAGDGEFRMGEQFLKMMKAQNLGEWKEAMKMRARTASNLTYADADGNIFYVWNATTPDLPHTSGGDTLAVEVSKTEEIWMEPVDWEGLPQLENPKGGYLRNENDPFHFTNLNEVLDKKDFPAHFPKPRLRLRSQHSLELIDNDKKFSLEEIVELKHSMGMLLADRVKEDLIEAVNNTNSTEEISEAIELIAEWDNTVSKESRGGILFKTWWNRYEDTADSVRVRSVPESAGFSATPERLFREVWSPDRPAETPYGLADPDRAADAFEWAVDKAKEQYGTWDLAWGDVHRARIGEQDLAVGGCTGLLGCFRVLWFVDHKDDKQKLEVRGGDGWVFAVEFGDVPKAYSVLAYGQSNKETSPHFNDQLKLFTENQMKRVVFTQQDVQSEVVREYRPGLEKINR